MKTQEVVTYKDFGATGDGKTDDLPAIVAAHAHANEHGLKVRAEEGATYYLGGKAITAIIQTDTDFGTARFVIDDTELENHRTNVFEVRSALKPVDLQGVEKVAEGQEKIDVVLPHRSLIIVQNDQVRHYIRKGLNMNDGSPLTDVLVVDPTGRVDLLTPVLWEVDPVTKMTAYPIDETQLTVQGGHFTTLANHHVSAYVYHGRGIGIQRSNVVVEGLEHHITGEGDQGAPYRGFLSIERCVDVTVRDSAFSGHKTFHTIGAAGRPVSMGSYDLHVNRSHNIVFENCRQLNDIHDRRRWGIMASNYSKNLRYDRCRFSRFDAHQGVFNATIQDSVLGHMGINLIGSGTFLLENSTVHSNRLVNLREDYGSTWEGEMLIRNSTFAPKTFRGSGLQLIIGSNTGDHDFGYPCFMPERIVLEGLHIDDADVPEGVEGPVIFSDVNPKYTQPDFEEAYPYIKTREVILRNVTTASGAPVRLSNNPVMFAGVEMTVETAD